jgi:small neutral amino acid transporter SnatA (MarC family)
MEKALKYEQQMKWTMIVVISLCVGMLLLDLFEVTAGGTQIGGPVVCFTVSMYAFGMRTIKELKSEIARLQAASGSEE